MDTATKTSVVPPATPVDGTGAKQAPVADQKAMSEKKPVRTRQDDRWKIFSGTANDALAKDICAFLELPLGKACIKRFSDGETYVQIEENVRGADVFMVQPTCDPVDVHLMQLLLLIDALKRASARRITVVIPYFGYARQDRKDKPRVPISS
jgi:ribose-phosphate pyrophosphokinase